MNETTKKIFIGLGIFLAVYIFLRYILPFLLKMLGFVIGVAFTIVVWALIGIAAIYIILYIVKKIQE